MDMTKTKCSLGNKKPDCCKDFPRNQSDIDTCGAAIKEKSICVADIGGANCNQCGQCCRDKPWPPEGHAQITKGENWLKLGTGKTKECIYLVTG